jgi:hypothetical protein
VDREDIEWGISVAERSLDAAVGGVEKYMRQYFEFPKFCDAVLAKITEAGGWMSKRDLGRVFRRHSRHGFELARALAQLVSEERIIEAKGGGGSRGAKANGYAVCGEE